MNGTSAIYDELAVRVQSAAESAESALDLASALRADAGELDQDPIAPLIAAFEYLLVRYSRRDEARRDSSAFAPGVEWEGGQFPPSLSELPEGWSTTWAEVAARTASPLVVSRLNDLLWELRFGERPDEHARAAISAYLALRDSYEPMVAPDALSRAIQLARALNDGASINDCARLAVAWARTAIEAEEWQPGAALAPMDELTRLPEEQLPTDVSEVLDLAKARYRSDPYIFQSVIELQAALARHEPAVERDLQAEAIERFRDEAAQSSGLLKFAHLQHALEIARAHGLRDQMEELRRELQSIGADELDLKSISAETRVPAEVIDEMLEQVADGDGWSACLDRFAVAYGPPSGSHDKNVEAVREMKSRFPLQFLISKVIFGPENTTLRHLVTDEDREGAALAQHERMRIGFWSLIAADALALVQERHGQPTEDELAPLFETAFIPGDLARLLSHGVVLWTKGAYDDSAHCLAPRIERAVREICRGAAIVVAREPIGSEPGGVRPLGHLLADLRGIVDESWRRYLVNALTEPLGLNLRNRVAHGLIGEVPRHDAALLVHIAAFLRTLRPLKPSGAPEES